LGVDTSIDEFFDDHLQRVLGASPETAESGSWYPVPRKVVVGATVEIVDLPRVDEVLCATHLRRASANRHRVMTTPHRREPWSRSLLS